jgi:nucleoside-diphosphate-sugar epimerase
MHALETLKKLVSQKDVADQVRPAARDTRIRAWEVKPKADFKSPADFEQIPSAGAHFDATARSLARCVTPVSSLDASLMRRTRTTSVEKILVTGGTGFIGGAVLAELINTTYWPQTLIMVRGATPAEARERIVRSLKRFLPDAPIESMLSDDQLIFAGLEDATSLIKEPRIRDVTHVIHSAAVTAFSNHPRIRAINVDASLKFVEVLKACARVQRFVNVGTAWCVGMDVEKLVTEDGEQGSAKHLVPYTESKLEFERLVRRLHADFPFVSARPSIVVGHTRYGTQPSGSIYWVFRSVHVLGKFTCSFDQPMDVVPVDWVAQALMGLAFKEELSFDTYHLSAGEESYSTIAQLDDAIAEGRNVMPTTRAHYVAVDDRQLTKAVYEKRKMLGDANPWLLSRALGLYARFAESGVLFDNSRTLWEGITSPPPFHTYAATCARTSENTSLSAQMEDDFK